MTMRIGYIGLGSLGRHLAGSLLRAGFPVTVHDIDRDAASALLAAGASWADSAAETARVSDTVITCLPSPEVVSAVVAGPHGILDRAGRRRHLDRHEHQRRSTSSSASPPWRPSAASPRSSRRSPAACTAPRPA